jgi:citrate synthase
MTPPEDRRLTTREAADRLGVRLETVYAYVSRGLLTSRRAATGRGSTFDRDEVEALLARDRRGGRAEPGAPSRPAQWRGPVVDTDITLIEDGRLFFRGVDAVALARAGGFERVAQWLWTGATEERHFRPSPEPLAAARAAVAALPATADLVSRLRVAVSAASSADPLRYDTRGTAVLATAAGLLATMVEGLPHAGTGARDTSGPPDPGGEERACGVPGSPSPMAARLWARLTPRTPAEGLLRCLDAALVVLVDHDLAVSTVAVRTAASARAHPYAVVATGLSAMEGPLHGAASTLAYDVLGGCLTADPRLIVAEHLRAGRVLPGLGHPLYPEGDPRASMLLELLGQDPAAAAVVAAVQRLAAAGGLHPNIDLALAALAHAAQMPRDAGEVVFSIARSVGWVAHALEEYDETPLRFRGQGHYRGPRPPHPVPWTS